MLNSTLVKWCRMLRYVQFLILYQFCCCSVVVDSSEGLLTTHLVCSVCVCVCIWLGAICSFIVCKLSSCPSFICLRCHTPFLSLMLWWWRCHLHQKMSDFWFGSYFNSTVKQEDLGGLFCSLSALDGSFVTAGWVRLQFGMFARQNQTILHQLADYPDICPATPVFSLYVDHHHWYVSHKRRVPSFIRVGCAPHWGSQCFDSSLISVYVSCS